MLFRAIKKFMKAVSRFLSVIYRDWLYASLSHGSVPEIDVILANLF